MSDPAALERRYRALLACYPADHRRTYGEEMIGVLLTSAPEGTTRPSIADTADLIGGGIRARSAGSVRRTAAQAEPGATRSPP